MPIVEKHDLYVKDSMLHDEKTAYVLAAILIFVMCTIVVCCCRIWYDLLGCNSHCRGYFARRRQRREVERLLKSAANAANQAAQNTGNEIVGIPLIITTEPSTGNQGAGDSDAVAMDRVVDADDEQEVEVVMNIKNVVSLAGNNQNATNGTVIAYKVRPKKPSLGTLTKAMSN